MILQSIQGGIDLNKEDKNPFFKGYKPNFYFKNKIELENGSVIDCMESENVTRGTGFHFYPPKYMGDLKAAERLKNDSLCVMENGQIRNIRPDEQLTEDHIIVHVENWHKAEGNNEYIEQGEYARYFTI